MAEAQARSGMTLFDILPTIEGITDLLDISQEIEVLSRSVFGMGLNYGR